MEAKLLLMKMIILIFNESLLSDKSDNSQPLVKQVLGTLKISDTTSDFGFENRLLQRLKSVLLDMLSLTVTGTFEVDHLIDTLALCCEEEEVLLNNFRNGIKENRTDEERKHLILDIRRSLMNHTKETELVSVFDGGSFKLKFQRNSITDYNSFIDENIARLEALRINIDNKDPAVLGVVDLNDKEAMMTIFEEAQQLVNGEGIMKLGLRALNIMFQGGLRRGEMVMINALQFNFKSGLALKLIMGIALYNAPYMLDETKKPLLVVFSFENELPNNFKFMYETLKYDETGIHPDTSGLSAEEMTDYVMSRMNANGFSFIMVRVDATQWTYRSLFNFIIDLESKGYEIHVCLLDYLAHIPTIGCVTNGPIGTDKRDLYRRTRNFFGSRKATCITPHQLSTDVKTLIRNGTPEHTVVKEIANRGYYEGSKQLDQEVDLSICIHVFTYNKKSYLCVQREKHRGVDILPEIYKYCIIPFPEKSPISDDIDKEGKTFFRSLKEIVDMEDGDSETMF